MTFKIKLSDKTLVVSHKNSVQFNFGSHEGHISPCTVRSEGFLYKVAPPELKISPIMHFVMYNSQFNSPKFQKSLCH